ncbi:MAG: restriction endonuclease [Firmicutes bacterium]|nr:restriction endonuclease [Bacillota bacterium]
MKMVQYYSHLNGYEYLCVHKPHLWDEIVTAINQVDAAKAFNKVSKEKTMMGKILYSPQKLNKLFKEEFKKNNWKGSHIYYYVNEDLHTTRATVGIRNNKQQQKEIERLGFTPFKTFNQVDFVKDRVAVEVQFGKYFSVQYDLHVKHTFFYQRDDIDVGIEIIPMHSLKTKMSSGPAYYENELANIVREGRSNPSVPIVLIGIEPDEMI